MRVDPTGVCGPTRKQARGRRWRTSSHGFFVPADVDAEDPCQRAVEASALLLPGEGVTGWAALAWEGGRWFGGVAPDGSALPVAIVAARHVVGQPGITVSQEFLRPGHVISVDGLAVTVPPRSVCYEARHADTLEDAVVAIDMAAYSDLVSIDEVWRHNLTLWTWTGVPQSRKAIGLADENSWSPQESRMRCVWVARAGRPRPLSNVPIFDRWGRHVATPDLLDPAAGIVGEYDGALHLVGAQRARDIRREAELRALGLEYVTMLAADRADGFRSFLRRLDEAYCRAKYAPENARDWTLRTPRWWVDTSTVDARRALSPELRRRLLRHRGAA